MSRAWIFIVLTVLLLANTPWFFTEPEFTHVYGFPPWAVYSLAMIILFAVVTSIFLGKYWSYLAEGVDESGDNSSESASNRKADS